MTGPVSQCALLASPEPARKMVNEGVGWAPWVRKLSLLGFIAYLQTTARQCSSTLTSGHFRETRHSAAQIRTASDAQPHGPSPGVLCLSSLHTLTALFVTWLTPACPSKFNLKVITFKNTPLTPIVQASLIGLDTPPKHFCVVTASLLVFSH